MSPTIYHGWRRPLQSFPDALWQRVAGVQGTTKEEAHASLMERTELMEGTFGQWEYLILPEGQTPPADPPTQRYRQRMLNPWHTW
jgi:hypothetical protein